MGVRRVFSSRLSLRRGALPALVVTAVAGAILVPAAGAPAASAAAPGGVSSSPGERNVEGRDFVTVRRGGKVLTVPTDLGGTGSLPAAVPSTKVNVSGSPIVAQGTRAAARSISPADGGSIETPDGEVVKAPMRAGVRRTQLVADGTWSWYMNPRALTTRAATYVGTTSTKGDIEVTRVSKAKHALQHARVARIDAALGRGVADDHASPSLLQTGDGRIAAFWSGHASTEVQYRVSTSADAMDFRPVQRLAGSGVAHRMATYTQVHYLRGDSHPYWLLTRLRNPDDNRNDWYLTRSKDLRMWTPAVQLFTNPYPKDVSKGWSYMKFVSDGQGTLDIAVTDGDPVNLATNSQFHIRYQDGVFSRSDGQPIRTMSDLRSSPMDPREGTLIYNGSSAEGPARVYDIQRDPEGRLALAMTTNIKPAGAPKASTYKWFVMTNGEWVGRTLIHGAEFAQGYDLVPGSTTRALLVNPGPTEQGRVQEWWSDDAGSTWTYRDVTPAADDRYRNPMSPWTPDAGNLRADSTITALWSAGRWDSWTNFDQAAMIETTSYRPVQLIGSTVKEGQWHARVRFLAREGVGGPPAARSVVEVTRTFPTARQYHSSDWSYRKYSAKTVTTSYTTTGSTRSLSMYAPRGTTVRVKVVAGVQNWGAGQLPTTRMR